MSSAQCWGNTPGVLGPVQKRPGHTRKDPVKCRVDHVGAGAHFLEDGLRELGRLSPEKSLRGISSIPINT